MNDDRDRLTADEAPIDTLLRERVGGEAPPDLARVVATRHARGDGAGAAERVASAPSHVRPPTRPWLAAALVLLGVGAVAGTIWSGRAAPDEVDPQARQTAQDPVPAGASFRLRVIDAKG
ncbi:MAG: hypothetical protein KAI24_10345, partial [Planctomycetes bacterium]|nr:hypothetical protein [Planctomycetota bacterium]